MAKVYVSSTILDLKSERKAVMNWLRKAGHQAVDSYLPNSESVRDSCLDDIRKCDLYVLILGHRYGFQPEAGNPEKLSITHLEFRQAGLCSIPRIALLRTNVPDIKKSDLENPERSPLVLAFREEVGRAVRPAQFEDRGELIQGLSTGVQSELDKLRASPELRIEAWLATHLQDLAREFANHMAATALKSGTHPEEFYLDLVVAERHPGKIKARGPEDHEIAKESYSLEEVIRDGQAPILLTGEGGAGKTTSLLYFAARAADRARADQTAPVPIYVNLARLTQLNDVPELLQLIADSVPLVKDWNELSELGIMERRRILFLFDSFNEMPEHLQPNGRVVLERFVEKQKDHHGCLIGSRLGPYIERLARVPALFKTFEILRLTPEKVQGFLQELGLGSLYERMPRELRELAGNPFVLLAIARTLDGAAGDTLPRNRGRLYELFVGRWIDNEKEKRGPEYHYERVKKPLLAYLANRMTSAGQTSLALTSVVEEEVHRHLAETYRRIKRLGGMPKKWTVDKCLAEILADGLLKQLDEQLHFMHQSVQEYFTGVYFFNTCPDALAAFTPKLLSEFVSTSALPGVPSHRFVPPLLMMAGLLDDSTAIVEALAVRNPILAAAAISSANQVEGSVCSKLEQSWRDLLKHDDLRSRAVACSCLAHASMTSAEVIRDVLALALVLDHDNSRAPGMALEKLDAPDAIASELIGHVRSDSDDEYKQREWRIGELVQKRQSASLVCLLFEQWRASAIDSSTRERFEGLLGSFDRSLLTEELQRIRTGASDPAVAADAERALAEAASWESVTGVAGLFSTRGLRKARGLYADHVAETLTRMRSMDSGELAASLHSSDPAVRAAAARLAAERQAPVGDVILESLVRGQQDRSQNELITALVSLLGEQTAASKLVERSRERCWCVGTLHPELADQLKVGELSESLKAEIERLGVQTDDLTLDRNETDGIPSCWILSSSSSLSYRRLYQLRVSPGCLELYDCNVAVKVFEALARIPGEASLAALQRAVAHDDATVQIIAINELAKRGDNGLPGRLLTQLGSTTSFDFISAALTALAVLRSREALSLVNDLLVITDVEQSEMHPIWGASEQFLAWGDAIHQVLVKLDADYDIQQALDRALASEEPAIMVAALKEFSRWFNLTDLGPERDATWQASDRLQRLFDLALRGSTESVRTSATDALSRLKSDIVQRSLENELADNEVEVQLSAGELFVYLAKIRSHELCRRVGEVMLRIAKSDKDQGLRRRAGRVLRSIPGGVDPLYQSIHEQLKLGAWERALKTIEAALDIIPEDVNLLWWRGHALRNLGRLDRAADSYQRAFELQRHASVIPQVLAQTLVELGDFPRSLETARLGVAIDPGDADAQSILAWSSYKAGAIREAVQAAGTAVDLDPVHGDAIWILLLGHLRQANLEESRLAFQHAQRVRQLLSPGLDASFVTSFVKELQFIQTDNAEISQLIEEIKDALV